MAPLANDILREIADETLLRWPNYTRNMSDGPPRFKPDSHGDSLETIGEIS
jgi:hypothetical protein